MENINIWKSGTLIVNSTGDGFLENNQDTFDSSGNVYTPNINGEILKVVINFTSSNNTATLTISSRDSPSENIVTITDWTSDITIYPVVEMKLNDNSSAADTNKTNVYGRYVIAGSLKISCSGATPNDTVVVKIYWR